MNNEEVVIDQQKTMNPIWSSLTKPRETITYIINNDRTMYYWILICFYGFIRSMDNYARRDYLMSPWVLILLIVFSPISGYIGCYFYAWLMSIFGSVFKGKASNEELRLSILWNAVPLMIIFPISISTFIMGADNIYVGLNVGLVIMYWIFAFIEIVVSIWVFINLIRMVSEVQGFSKGRAFLSIILPAVIVVSVLLGIMIPLSLAA